MRPPETDAGVGRNDPCPCGSGVKYKKCCLRKAAGPAGRRARSSKPASHAALLQRATALHQKRRFAEAAALYEQVVDHKPRSAVGWFGLGQVRGHLGEGGGSLDALRRAVALDPDNAQYHISLADSLWKRGELHDALQHARRGVAIEPGHQFGHCVIAVVLEHQRRLEDALDAARRAVSLDRNNPHASIILARLLRRTKRHEEAREVLEPVVADERHADFHPEANNELGFVLDRLERHDEAFEAFRLSGRQLRRTPHVRRIDGRVWHRRIRSYRRGLSRRLFSRAAQHSYPDRGMQHAFLVGFPRSGTTMTEQILAAHPRIITADEKPLIQRVKEAATRMVGDESLTMPQVLERLSRDDIDTLREHYVSNAETVVDEDPNGRVFLDKLPLNLIDLGVINVVFPEARILVALRDPRDVCLSCFMQQFGLNTAMVNFLDWEETAEFYAEVMRLWLTLKPMLTLDHLEIRYEDTVNDLEAQARRMTDFLGVGWDDAVLEFQSQSKDRAISTPSFAAVAERVHTRAAGRWRRYARHVRSVEPQLHPFIEAFGYSEEDSSGH